MKLGIMQPYFFPYLGYYSLIYYTDRFILFDAVQFIQKGWIERNRILKPGPGWQYISVPLEKHKRETLINEIRIRNNENWRERIIRQLEHYKKRAPFYEDTIALIKRALDIETDSIVKLNANILLVTCDYLGFNPSLDIFSEMNIDIEEIKGPGDWALNISHALNADEYTNPSSGYEIFNPHNFSEKGISLRFISNNLSKYKQRRGTFEPALSIIDVLMFNSRDETRSLINDFKVSSIDELIENMNNG